MKTCHVVGAGELSPSLVPQMEPGDFLIAADAGLRFLRSVGLTPDLFVGDGDSLGQIPSDLPCAALPRVKDDTDTLAAVKIGLEKGYRRFLLYGALGGKRFSHSIANLQTLAFLADRGASGTILAPGVRVTLLTPGAYPEDLSGSYFSLFAEGGEATVSISGARYELDCAVLTPSFPLGVSNEGSPKTVITVHRGRVALIVEPLLSFHEKRK